MAHKLLFEDNNCIKCSSEVDFEIDTSYVKKNGKLGQIYLLS